MSIELIRTVEHVYDDESTRITQISVITFDDGDKSILIRDEHGQDSVSIVDEAHAKAMWRAIKAAGAKLDWELD